MHAFLIDYGLFLAEAVTIVVAIAVIIGLIVQGIHSARGAQSKEHIEIRHLNQRLRGMADSLLSEILDDKAYKHHHKQRKKDEKARRKGERKSGKNLATVEARPRLFVLDFEGDIQASQTTALREEISAILQVAQAHDEVLLRLESAGGLVHSYGLAASELRRLRDKGLKLTVAVDKVAASGGYMMACVADHLIAAPFAVLGSIGVVAQLPNFHRWLDKNDVDIELHTAGEYKRTLTMFGENSDAARRKFTEELEETHVLFKSFVTDNRPQVPIDRVATGEHWYGTRALEMKLVDQISTSDDYLLDKAREHEAYEIHYKVHLKLRERLMGQLTRLTARLAAPDLPFGRLH